MYHSPYTSSQPDELVPTKKSFDYYLNYILIIQELAKIQQNYLGFIHSNEKSSVHCSKNLLGDQQAQKQSESHASQQTVLMATALAIDWANFDATMFTGPSQWDDVGAENMRPAPSLVSPVLNDRVDI